MAAPGMEEKEKEIQVEDAPEESFEVLEYKKKEKAVVRKLDIFIAPVMMMNMLISYLDRGNIGFAATQGMAKDIHLKGTQLNVLVSISIRCERMLMIIFRLPSPSFISSIF
jgi:hypothetical protein